MQRCKKCGELKPATRDHFGSTPSGNLRGTCRPCMAANTKKHSQTAGNDAARWAARKERSSGFKLSDAQRRDLWSRQDGNCPCCFQALPSMWDAEMDHVTPVARGGRDDISNVMLTHAQCNREKHNKTLDEHWDWRVKVGLDAVSIRTRFHK